MKLDTLGKKGIFFGYNDTLKAYRVYILCFKKIETSRYVTFDEDETFSTLSKIHSDGAHEQDLNLPGSGTPQWKRELVFQFNRGHQKMNLGVE